MIPLYFKSGRWLKWFYPSLEWEIKNHNGHVFLTFDDGPHPVHTPWVLDQLDALNFKATFFCIGNNVSKYPEVYAEIIARGHATGNHTYHHLNGYRNDAAEYINDVEKCGALVHSKLFRPPYGRITRTQIKQLRPDYRIVMWSLLSGDFDARLNRAQSLKALKNSTSPGSIVVFHDSDKAAANLYHLLPEYLGFLVEKGFVSQKL